MFNKGFYGKPKAYINSRKLMSIMKKEDVSLSDVADSLGMSRQSFYRRLTASNNKDFTLSEVNKLIPILKLSKEDVWDIFFYNTHSN